MLFGDWGTSRLYVLGIAFFFAGRASFWLICGMSLLVMAVGWAYTHICRIYPDGGGVYAAARRKSEILGVIGALLLFADYTITASLSALEAFHYFGMHDAPSLLHLNSAGAWAVACIVLIGLFNLLGPKHTSGFALVAAIGMIAVTLVITFGSLFQIDADTFAHSIELPSRDHITWGNTWTTWAHFVSIVLALSGVEAIANLTGVLKKPVQRTAAKAIWTVALEVAIFNVLLAFVMVAASKTMDVVEHKEDMLAFLSGHYIGLWAEWSVRILGGLLLLSATNTAIGGIIAVVYLLSRDGEAPRPLQALNRFGVPWMPAFIAFLVPAGVLAGVHLFGGQSPMLLLAALYAIGVIGAVTIDVTLCAVHPRLRRWYRKGPMFVLAGLLILILLSLAHEKVPAVIFVSVVMVVGLSLRWITKYLAARDPDRLSLLREATIEQLSADIAGKPKMLIGTYGSTALAEQAIDYARQHQAALVVCFVRELALNEHVFTEQGRLTIDTDPVALKTFAHYLHLGHDRSVPIIPAYDTGNDAATAMAETAAMYACDRILIGTSRKGALHRFVKGSFQTRLESLLPHEIKVEVLQPQMA